jgi:hypothetical protein
MWQLAEMMFLSKRSNGRISMLKLPSLPMMPPALWFQLLVSRRCYNLTHIGYEAQNWIELPQADDHQLFCIRLIDYEFCELMRFRVSP